MNFSESPRHFDVIVLDDTLKKLNLPRVSEDNALARALFPVPGGPCNRVHFQPMPTVENNSGYCSGRTVLSVKIFCACEWPTISFHLYNESARTRSL